MFKFVISDDNPIVLIITPLKESDTKSDHTVDSIIGTKVPIHWISYSGDQNPYKNFNDGLKYYQRFYSLPKYIIKVDNDINAELKMLDKMVQTLEKSDNDIAYTYCDFRFQGTVNLQFRAIPFNADKLMKSNYISSISLIKTEALERIGGVEIDDRYFRLLDWVLWLKFLKNGYKGIPTYGTSFIAYSNSDSISNRGYDDYVIKYKNVYNDFVLPILNNK